MKELKLYNPEKSSFSNINKLFVKILPNSQNNMNSLLISLRRNDVAKKYNSYIKNKKSHSKSVSSNSVKKLFCKFLDSYELYIESLNDYIMNKIYKRVKRRNSL